jgi:hypothetical protein
MAVVYIGNGINDLHAEMTSNWLSRDYKVEYTLNENLIDTLSYSSLLCIPNGDANTIVYELKPFSEAIIDFVKKGGYLVTIGGGYHAMVKLGVIHRLYGSSGFCVNDQHKNNSSKVSHDLYESPYFYDFSSTIVEGDPRFSLCDSSGNPHGEYLCMSCCEYCEKNYTYDEPESISTHVFDKNMNIVCYYKCTKAPSIILLNIDSVSKANGKILIMSVIPTLDDSTQTMFYKCLIALKYDAKNPIKKPKYIKPTFAQSALIGFFKVFVYPRSML